LTEKPRTWGYVLEAPRRPPLKKQLDALRSMGIDVRDFGPVWRDQVDKVKRGRGAKNMVLEGRGGLLNAVQAGDSVIVADPYCVGLSPDDAKAFISALSEAGVTLTVSGRVFRVQPGESADDLLAEIERRKNAAHVANYRAKGSAVKPKRKRKRKTST
jgi:hypothetical protein